MKLTLVTDDFRKYCWPLLVDPDDQAAQWVQALQTDSLNNIDEVAIINHKHGKPRFSYTITYWSQWSYKVM